MPQFLDKTGLATLWGCVTNEIDKATDFANTVLTDADVYLSNAYNGPLANLQLYGKTTQNGTPTVESPIPLINAGQRKNLFDVFNDDINKTRNGTANKKVDQNTVDKEGNITIDIVDSATYGVGFLKTLPANVPVTISYKITSIGNGESLACVIYDINDYQNLKMSNFATSSGSVAYTYTPTVNSTYLFGWYVKNGTAPCGAQITDVQLEFGETATKYEPYAEGNNIAIEVRGKNLLINGRTTKNYTHNGITFIENADGTITANGTNNGSGRSLYTISANDVWTYLPAGTYTIYSGLDNKNGYFQFSHNDQPVSAGSTAYYSYDTPKTVTLDKPQWCWLAVCIVSGATVSNLIFKPQIEVGTEATEYESYRKTRTLIVPTLNGLPGIKVESGGNYADSTGQQWVCDEIDLAKGVYVKRIGQIHLDGTQTIISITARTDSIRVTFRGYENAKREMIQHSNRLEHKSAYSQDIIGFVVASDGMGACILGLPLTAGTTAETVSAWIAENPIDIQYILATPIETPLSAELCNSFANTNTWSEGTYILNQKSVPMQITYGTTNMTEINDVLVNSKANKIHNHDDRYYTEKEIDEKLTIKCPVQAQAAVITNGANNNLMDLKLYGQTVQDGTPSLEAPVAFLNKGGRTNTITAKSVGKNLVNLANVSTTHSGVTLEQLEDESLRIYTTTDGTYKGARLRENIWLLKGVTYTLSCEVTNITSGSIRVGMRHAYASNNPSVNSGQFISNASLLFTEAGYMSVTFTPTRDIEAYLSLLVTWSPAASGDATFKNLQLEINDEATPYEPHLDTSGIPIAVPGGLRGIPVTSGGDYTDKDGQQWISDVLNVKDKVITTRLRTFTLNGSDAQSITNIYAQTNTIRFWVYLPELKTTESPMSADQLIMCDSMPISRFYEDDRVSIQAGTSMGHPYSVVVKLPTAAGTTTTQLKSYLASHNIQIIVATDTYDYIDVEIDDGLEENIFTQEGIPVSIYNTAGAEMSFKYVTDNLDRYSGVLATPEDLQILNPIQLTTENLYLKSSTEGSTKIFQITVDDSGTLTAIEV